MPHNVASSGRLPMISTGRRSASATNFSTSTRNTSRASCHSFSANSITPIRTSRSANSKSSRGSVVSSNCGTYSDRSISNLSCEELTDYQLKRQRMKDGKFGKLFQNYFPERAESPPEISEPSDDEPYETDLDSDIGTELIRQEKGRHRHEHEYKYGQLCQQLKVVPNNFFLRHGKTEELSMKYRYLNYGDATAMASLIRSQDLISKLDLSDNGIGPAAMLSLAELLLYNKTITEVNFSNNRIGTYGARLMKTIMQNNNKLNKVDISGNCIGEKGGLYCSHIIQHNIYLKEFKIGNNKIGDKGAVAIGKALGNNVTLELLDVSWNHIQLPGALAIARGVKNNEQLKILRVGMNGFSKAGTQALVECLHNTSIIELDLSSNRIGAEGAKLIADVLKKSTLQKLNLSGNPLTAEGAKRILNTVNNCCQLVYLDLQNVVIDDEFITTAENIKTDNDIDIRYSYEPCKRKSSRELSKCELEELARILVDTGVRIRDIFDDVISVNSMMRVEDLLYMIEMSERCSDDIFRSLKQKTAQTRNHRFILKDLLAMEDHNMSGGELNKSCTADINSSTTESIIGRDIEDDLILPSPTPSSRTKNKRKIKRSSSRKNNN
ncbi:hypothetical protein SNE40_009445 [Patella caerulea]|uniref:Uncharacterized protein n=1 Tax=Patella caerulea TaxID=87958 RepID=A0AAN8JVH0_PATCE